MRKTLRNWIPYYRCGYCEHPKHAPIVFHIEGEAMYLLHDDHATMRGEMSWEAFKVVRGISKSTHTNAE